MKRMGRALRIPMNLMKRILKHLPSTWTVLKEKKEE
jgi:hypothetical protein